MRQLWISVGILVVMVALLFWNVVKVDQLTQPMLKELSQATTAARGDDWPAAESFDTADTSPLGEGDAPPSIRPNA